MQEMGAILLAGGSEFSGEMEIPDRKAIEMAGGRDAPISILPTAAAPDNNHRHAGQRGADWFSHLGAANVSVGILKRSARMWHLTWRY